MHDHLQYYVDVYDAATDKGKLDLLEYKLSNGNQAIHRELLADYLSLKVAKSNYRLQWIIGIFAAATAISTVIQVAKLLNWIH